MHFLYNYIHFIPIDVRIFYVKMYLTLRHSFSSHDVHSVFSKLSDDVLLDVMTYFPYFCTYLLAL